MRTSPRFNANYDDEEAAEGTIEPRTHGASILAGRASDAFTMAYDNAIHPRKKSGINGTCVFCLLDLFNVISDFMADFMHMSKGVIKDHLMDTMKGVRGQMYSWFTNGSLVNKLFLGA